MRRYQVCTLGQDLHLLKAVAGVALEAVRVEPIQCTTSYLEHLNVCQRYIQEPF